MLTLLGWGYVILCHAFPVLWSFSTCSVPDQNYLLFFYHIGYHEEGHNFGVVKKGKYKPASDFGFEFVAEVICQDPHSSGFMIELTPDRDEQSDAPPCTRYNM